MALSDVQMMDQCMRSLVGSYREGTLRCILDTAETYPDRPAGMYDIARGQCRSLSEDPRRSLKYGESSARGKPRSFRPLDMIQEEELGEDLPITHAIFLPKEDDLPSAPSPCVGKSDACDEEAAARRMPEKKERARHHRRRPRERPNRFRGLGEAGVPYRESVMEKES